VTSRVQFRARALGGALTIAVLSAGAAAQEAQAQLDTLMELGAALRACWIPPPADPARSGMQITVLMSFRRNGELFGEPRITFISAGASDAERLAYRIAVAEMLKRCTPLPFTDGLGNAVAGRPFTMRLINE
jgi:hypothetical protein